MASHQTSAPDRTNTQLSDPRPLPMASPGESLAVAAEVLAPLIARGIIKRRRSVTDLASRADADARAVRRLQALRAEHGSTTVGLTVPGRSVAVVLDPDDAKDVLARTPEPFAAATGDKRSALEHFQPGGVLVSHGPERAERRRFNEAVLDTDRPQHRLADDLLAKAIDETDRLADLSERIGALTHDDIAGAWWRMVRRVVLGDAAADDHAITDLIAELRGTSNWAFAAPRRRRTQAAFDARLAAHLLAAEPGSLAALVASEHAGPATDREQQVPQWLFAFDAALIAAVRSLALFATHPAEAATVRREVAGVDLRQPADLPSTRALVLESLRLWPTTPAILRETTEDAELGGVRIPAGTELLIHAPYLHRDDENLADADRLALHLWRDGRDEADWPLVPFSAGPAMCAGRNLVLLLTGAVVGRLVQRLDLDLTDGAELSPDAPLPGTLSPFSLQFQTRTAAA
jgi:cytochrome P450